MPNTNTKTPTSSIQWILKELSKCLKKFYTPVEVLRRAIPMRLPTLTPARRLTLAGQFLTPD